MKPVRKACVLSSTELGKSPGKEPLRRVGLSEARPDQLTLDHIPWWKADVANDLFFADDLVILGDPVEVAGMAHFLVRLENF